MNIKPYDTTIQKLLSSGFYKIPRFQRPYSWDKGNVEEFWTDIAGAKASDHFIGSMVFYAVPGSQEQSVVDGQQRLTTITVFLAALRDVMTSAGEAQLGKGVQAFIERLDLNAQNRFVLLTESSYPYLQDNIQRHGAPELEHKPSEEEKGIQNAYDFAKGIFEKEVANVRAAGGSAASEKSRIKKRLEEIRNFILGLETIIIQLDNEDDAYLVFETLNTRGRDLEPKDLIKNLVTRYLPPKSADLDTAKLKWNEMVKAISESANSPDLSTYLHHHWLSLHDYTPARTLFGRVKKTVRGKAQAKEYLDSITGDVESYQRIFEPDAFKWLKEEDGVRKSLLALNVFKVRQATPLVLALLRSYFAKTISLKQARDTISTIERFHFAYTAVAGQSSSGGVSQMYAAAARDLSSEADAQKRAKHLKEFAGKMAARQVERGTFDSGLSALRYSKADTRDKPLIRYILERLDAYLRTDAVVDFAKMTIEHIAPQNPAGAAAVSLYSSIGNLIFISEGLNGDLGNKDFGTKKKVLTNAGVPMDDILKNATTWGDAEIAARTKLIADLLYSNKA